MPSVETVSSTQPFFVAVWAAGTVGKPDHAIETGLLYQPFDPSGLAGVTAPHGKPGPLSPGPVSCGLLRPAPLGYAVSNHCVKKSVSRELQDALCTGRWLRKTSSSWGSVMFFPP